MKVFVAFVTALLLTACQSLGLAAPEVWYHKTKGEAEFAVDKRECEYDAQRNLRFSGSPIMDRYELIRVYSACMQSRGYYSTT